ncbi:MAG: hypothetical protein ABIL58_09805 [Pseudomonadota bacterium]
MKKEVTIFDDPKNVKRLLWFFFAVLAILVIADFFISKHGHFPFEDHSNFFSAYGFVACVAVIFASKVLRFFLGRPETYYDERRETTAQPTESTES